jgi:hypothetical protein
VNFNGEEYTDCDGCEVSTYTDFNVTFACTVPDSRRALSSGQKTSQFGTTLGPSVANHPKPTKAPTSAPSDSGGKTSDTTLIIGLVVGIGGGVIVIALLAFYFLSSSKKIAIAPAPGAEPTAAVVVPTEP